MLHELLNRMVQSSNLEVNRVPQIQDRLSRLLRSLFLLFFSLFFLFIFRRNKIQIYLQDALLVQIKLFI